MTGYEDVDTKLHEDLDTKLGVGLVAIIRLTLFVLDQPINTARLPGSKCLRSVRRVGLEVQST